MSLKIKSSPQLNIKTKVKKTNFFNDIKVVPYVFVMPFIISILLFFIYPIISAFIMSLQKIDGPRDVTFIGFQNYSNLLNEHFYNALKVTSTYTFWTILILIPLPLILAVFLNSKITIGKNFFRSAFFIPALISVIVAGYFFNYIVGSPDTAIINAIVHKFGMESRTWLQEKPYAMIILVTFCVWRWLGVNIVYFLSGLQGIPIELYESANIDGASPIKQFFKITLPSLKPIILYVITISVFGGYSMFAESYVLYNGPSSPGEIGSTLITYIYQTGFNNNNMGAGAAVGFALLFVVMIVNILQLTLFGFFKKESD